MPAMVLEGRIIHDRQGLLDRGDTSCEANGNWEELCGCPKRVVQWIVECQEGIREWTSCVNDPP